MILFFALINFAFSNEVVIEIGPNKYKITKATFYETSSDANDPKKGFKSKRFYKKYSEFITKYTPAFESRNSSSSQAASALQEFDYCISEKLRMRTSANQSKKSLPFNSLEASAIACHAQQFPQYSVVKKSNNTDSELIYASGSYSLLLEAALLSSIDSKFLRIITEKLKPTPFGHNTCLKFDPSNPKCIVKTDRCNQEGNEMKSSSRIPLCADKICEQFGKSDHIYINNAMTAMSDLEQMLPLFKRFGLDRAKSESLFNDIKSYRNDSSVDEGKLCVRCPASYHPSEVTSDCLDSDGCSLMYDQIYSTEFGECMGRECLENNTEEGRCPTTCKKKCEKNIEILKSILAVLSNNPNVVNFEIAIYGGGEVFNERDVSSRDYMNTLGNTTSIFDGLSLNEFESVVKQSKENLIKRISDYDIKKENCSSQDNSCFGFYFDLIKIIEGVRVCPAGEIYNNNLSKCFKVQCKTCLEKMNHISSLTAGRFYADNLSIFSTCGSELTSYVFEDYRNNLNLSFHGELLKCQENLTYNCNGRPEISASDLIPRLSASGYDCHLGNSRNTSKSTKGADKP